MKDSRQVIIYFDDPKGQLLQVSYANYRSYWQRIGWKLQDKAPHLPGIVPDTARTQARGLQPNLI